MLIPAMTHCHFSFIDDGFCPRAQASTPPSSRPAIASPLPTLLRHVCAAPLPNPRFHDSTPAHPLCEAPLHLFLFLSARMRYPRGASLTFASSRFQNIPYYFATLTPLSLVPTARATSQVPLTCCPTRVPLLADGYVNPTALSPRWAFLYSLHTTRRWTPQHRPRLPAALPMYFPF